MNPEHLYLLARWAHHRPDEYNAFVERSQHLTERQAQAELLLTMLEAIASITKSSKTSDFTLELMPVTGGWSVLWGYSLWCGDEAEDLDPAIALLKVRVERLEREARS